MLNDFFRAFIEREKQDIEHALFGLGRAVSVEVDGDRARKLHWTRKSVQFPILCKASGLLPRPVVSFGLASCTMVSVSLATALKF